MTAETAEHTQTVNQMVYLGAPGSGLGWRLSGVDVVEFEEADAMLRALRRYREEGQYHILLVDERLAEPVLADIEKLNEEALPVIILLPNPAQPLNVTQERMNNLVIQAVGSDIFSS